METLSKGFKELREANSKVAKEVDQFPTLQVTCAAAENQRKSLVPVNRCRSVSPSVKRKADEVTNPTEQSDQQQGDNSWSTVASRAANKPQGRKNRPMQHGTAQVKVAGGEAAPYDVVVGNTNPASTDDIIKDVLIHVSENMEENLKLKEPLHITEVECLTKPRSDGSRIWTKTWRVQVPARFKEHMLRPEAYPAGWTCRRFFPPKAPKPPVPELYPQGGPPEKRPNLGVQQNNH